MSIYNKMNHAIGRRTAYIHALFAKSIITELTHICLSASTRTNVDFLLFRHFGWYLEVFFLLDFDAIQSLISTLAPDSLSIFTLQICDQLMRHKMSYAENWVD